jgi:HK97 family phage prohead protease
MTDTLVGTPDPAPDPEPDLIPPALDRAEAAAKRRAHFEAHGGPGDQLRHAATLPNGGARRVSTRDLDAPSQLRAKKVDRDGKQFYEVTGYFTVYERGYEMWDWAGPYTEVVSAGAAEETIAAGPDVVFLVNHAGLAMARTVSGTLELWSDDTGGGNRVFLNPTRQDVKDLVAAVEDGTITEQSFGFMITAGQWSPDYMEFRINSFDMDRGDTSAVNYGANPYTSVSARAREILDSLDQLPAGAARAALDRLQHRTDLTDPSPEQMQQAEQAAMVGRGSVAKWAERLTASNS